MQPPDPDTSPDVLQFPNPEDYETPPDSTLVSFLRSEGFEISLNWHYPAPWELSLTWLSSYEVHHPAFDASHTIHIHTTDSTAGKPGNPIPFAAAYAPIPRKLARALIRFSRNPPNP